MPVRVMTMVPPLGIVTEGVNCTVVVTTTFLAKALLLLIIGWSVPRGPTMIAGRTPADDAPIWFTPSSVAVLYDAATRVVLSSWTAVGFDTPVKVITSAPDGIGALNPRVSTLPDHEALLQPGGELVATDDPV